MATVALSLMACVGHILGPGIFEGAVSRHLLVLKARGSSHVCSRFKPVVDDRHAPVMRRGPTAMFHDMSSDVYQQDILQ